ncbi:MAG: DNA translocase FtsK [Ruminococcus sp.]|nr:DNA translocase FtsK [Ruminococcus sp.]
MAEKKGSNTKKKTTKKPSKNADSKAAVKRSQRHKREKRVQRKRNYRVEAIIYAALALLTFFVIIIPGANVWTTIRGIFFGFFGLCSILVPLTFAYLTVITALEKEIAHFKTKVIMCIAIILLTEAAVYLLSDYKFEDRNFFAALGSLFGRAFDSSSYFTTGGGFFSGIIGYPIYFAFHNPAAILVVLVLLAALILIIGKISLNDVARAAKYVGHKVSDTSRKSRQYIRTKTQKTPEIEYSSYDNFDTLIDIPLDDNSKKKKRRNKRSIIDISIDDDSNAAKSDPADDFIDAINKAQSKEETAKPVETDEVEEAAPKPRRRRTKSEQEKSEAHATYKYPPIGLLKAVKNNGADGEAEMRANAQKLISTLESFGVQASITHISRGPSVTRYELHPAPGVKINKITNLSDDIALNLAANGIRIEAPIPGKAAVGIEVPNKSVNVVSIRELIDSDEFESSSSKLTCVLGRDISGKIVTTDIAKLPHLLIAGTTGSGKSVCVNSLLISILYKASPDEVKLVLIDPKMVEFSKYKGIPHLLIPVVSDAKKAAGALAWAVNEMQNRYKLFSEFDCKDIDGYNKLIESNLEYMRDNPPVYNEEKDEEEQPVLEVNGLPVAKEKLPRIVIAIDELADLMMTAPGEVEDSIVRLAQLARAAGMHLVIATQRPTANVITGLIKANVPSRIALKVGSNMDSRIILDTGGAEKLIGRGDMLYMPVGAPNPIRVQGCYATEDEIGGVTRYIKKSYTAQYNEEIEERIKRIAAEELEGGASDSGANTVDGIELDSKMEDAIKYVIESGQASTSMIQRRFKVGYARAGRMIDDMEQLGIVEPHQGSKPRKVLMTYGEWLERSNNLKG